MLICLVSVTKAGCKTAWLLALKALTQNCPATIYNLSKKETHHHHLFTAGNVTPNRITRNSPHSWHDRYHVFLSSYVNIT